MSLEEVNLKAKDLWNRAKMIFLSSLHNEDDKNTAERYFSNISCVSLENDIFIISTSNSFSADLIKNNYGLKIKECLNLAGGDPSLKIEFKLDENKKPAIISPIKKEVQNNPTQISQQQNKNKAFISTMPLNPYYTFEEFVKGPSNSWAHAAAKGVVENPGAIGYNPLFIHGGTGLGKTHLMQAIGNALLLKNPLLSICYLTAETFLNEYVNALQNSAIQSFRERYRKIDVLLVDDVQFLQKGKQFQEEFFNTFNVLTGEKKQIVMTSDVAPKDLPLVESRLIGRFEGGMVQEIESPNYETRLAILNKKAESMIPPIPNNCIKFIAENIKSHVRAMEGALAKVRIMVSMNPSENISLDMLNYQLKDFIEKEQAIRKISIEEIQNIVANKYQILMAQMLSTERTQSIVTPRQMAMYIARKYTTKSLQEIANVFDKSHATILHGVKTIEKRMDVEKDLKNELEEILTEFGLKSTDKME